MEFLIWMAIGIALMAVELCCTGRYFRSHRLLCISLGRFCSSWRRNGSAVCSTRINGLLIVLIIVFFNHFEKT